MIAGGLSFAAAACAVVGVLTLLGDYARIGRRRRGAGRGAPGPRLLRGLATVGRRAAGGRAPRELEDRIAAAGRPAASALVR